MYLLDTMLISEGTKPIPHPKVRAWIGQLPPNAQFISVISLGEIEFGIARLPPGAQKTRLQRWRAALSPFFSGRILHIDHTVAERWGQQRAAASRTIPFADALIGATAHIHGLTVATRNERDFIDLGVRVINPWRT